MAPPPDMLDPYNFGTFCLAYDSTKGPHIIYQDISKKNLFANRSLNNI